LWRLFMMHVPRCFLLLLMLQILNHANSCCTHSPSRCYIKPRSHHMNCTRVLKMCEQTGTFTSHELEFANYAIQFAVSSANQYEIGRYVMTTRPVNAWSKGLFTTRELNSTELTCNKSTQLHEAFIGRARQHHDLIGCSETRTVVASSVHVL